jgi:hypothetical protein
LKILGNRQINIFAIDFDEIKILFDILKIFQMRGDDFGDLFAEIFFDIVILVFIVLINNLSFL